MDFYGYRVHARAPAVGATPYFTAGNPMVPHDFSALHRAGRLWQEWLLDAYLKMEKSRLEFQRHNQKKLRADLYHGLEDAVLSSSETTKNSSS